MRQLINQSFIIFLIVATIGLLYLLSPILTPFFTGALIAYLASPLVTILKRLGVPHLISVILVFFFVIFILALLVLLLVPLIEKQIVALIDALPGIVNWIQETVVPKLKSYFDIDEVISPTTVKAAIAATGPKVEWVLKTVLHSSMTVALWLTNLLLIPVVTFYLLRDWDLLMKNLRGLLPRSIEPTAMGIVKECNEVLSAFFRGQFLVMLGLGCIYSIGLSLIGLKIGLIIGLIAGLLSIVPYLGLIVGFSAASIAALVQFGDWHALLGVGAVFLVGQGMEGFVLTPMLVGHRIGLHPVAVIFAVLAGGTLFGFMGVLLALPVAAVIMVFMRFFNKRYRASAFYK
jgi:predicted PurR-regulated permease PerM